MVGIVTGGSHIRYDRLSLIPLGGQSEVGQVLWILSWGGELLLIDAGAAYPGEDLPGVDLILPNTNFLEANQERILALLLTNGHEEHSGAVAYLLSHLTIPRIMGPRFVATLTAQHLMAKGHDTTIDTIKTRHPYQIGSFEVEWIQVNDAIADACALKIGTPEGVVIYTSSFKLDQTPVDKRLMDVARLTQIGDAEVLLLISDSAGVENHGYTPSEKSVMGNFTKYITESTGRVIIVLPGTNTHRLQILFDLAQRLKRKVVLFGETLIQTALVAAVTGNLLYDRKIEASLEDLPKLPDNEVLIIATGHEGDPFKILEELAYNKSNELSVKESDTIIYSADVAPGRLRRLAMIQDQLLCLNVKAHFGAGIHVSKHASQEELKLMLSIIKPRFFVPALGEGRHIMHHAQLAQQWGMTPESVFPLKNGEILEIGSGGTYITGEIESQAVLYNREQGERVTTFSVHERKTLSLEGVVTVGCVVDSSLALISGPTIMAGASGFLQSTDWLNTKQELLVLIAESITNFKNTGKQDIGALRVAIREIVSKTLKVQLQAKPTIQVVVHQLATSLPE